MQCLICKTSNIKQGTKTVLLEKGSTIIVFKNVPALVCDQCGEGYTDEDVTQQLQDTFEEESKRGSMEAFIQYAPCLVGM